MTTKQLVIISIVLIMVVMILIVQIGEDFIGADDVIGIVGFVAGAGFVVAFNRGGK